MDTDVHHLHNSLCMCAQSWRQSSKLCKWLPCFAQVCTELPGCHWARDSVCSPCLLCTQNQAVCSLLCRSKPCFSLIIWCKTFSFISRQVETLWGFRAALNACILLFFFLEVSVLSIFHHVTFEGHCGCITLRFNAVVCSAEITAPLFWSSCVKLCQKCVTGRWSAVDHEPHVSRKQQQPLSDD